MRNHKAMISGFVATTFVAVTLVALAAQSPIEAVAKAETEFLKASVARDKATLERLLSNDLVYIHGMGGMENKEKFIKSAMTPLRYRTMDFLSSNRRVVGDVVITHHKMNIKDKAHPELGEDLYVTFVWANEAGHWKLSHRHATLLKDYKK